jgi:hypothetical protein
VQYLEDACIPFTTDHDILKTIVEDSPWTKPVRVYGYNSRYVKILCCEKKRREDFPTKFLPHMSLTFLGIKFSGEIYLKRKQIAWTFWDKWPLRTLQILPFGVISKNLFREFRKDNPGDP